MLLCIRTDGPIVDNRTAGDRICAIVNQNRGIREAAICVLMTRTELRKLARCTSYAILVALGTRRRVKHGTKAALWIMPALKLLLI